MKAVTLSAIFLGFVVLAYAGRHSDSDSSSSSSESSDTSESKHSSWFGSRFRSAGCRFAPAANISSNVHGYLHIYQKREGDAVWIKGGLRDLSGPAGMSYALAFHQNPPSPGCSNIGRTMENVGGDIVHMVAKGQHWGTGVKVQTSHISLEDSTTNSVIGHSVVLRETASGKVVACCPVVRNNGRD